LLEMAVRRGEGTLADTGALVVGTGKHTGRSPKDRFIVAEPSVKSQVFWGPINQPMEPAVFNRLLGKARAYLQKRELFVQDGWACADSDYRLQVRLITDAAWHALFTRCLLIRPPAEALDGFTPDFTILHAPDLHADPKTDGTRTGTFILLSFEQRIVL